MIRVGIVVHTHWDREWHAPFPATRLRLVRLLDELLPALEADRSGTCVCLDGQTAMVDDYLELRPEARERIGRLVRAGRLSVGPFVVPPDEFCVSGETLIRNLEVGMRRAEELGGVMAVGYLPDCFGHIAQLPQLLRHAGIGHAVVWRGVPAALETTAFWWEAPDGSRVRAEHLYGSYANGKNLPGDGGGLVARAGDYEHEVGGARAGGLLLMAGGDQRSPRLDLAPAAAEANGMQTRYRFQLATLEGWLAGEPADGLPIWQGELRSAARAHLLSGVVSARVDLKRAAAGAERALEQVAEPLLALFRPAPEWAAAEPALRLAWRNLVLNSAHDSACGCVADEVAETVRNRYEAARHTAEALTAEAMAALAAEVGGPAGGFVVANPLPRARRRLIEVETGAEDWPGAQVLGRFDREVFAATVVGRKVGWVLALVGAGTFDGRPIRAYELGPGAIILRAGTPPVDLAPIRRYLAAAADGGEPVTVRVVEGPLQRLLLDTGEVDGFGWTVCSRDAPVALTRPVTAGDTWVDNGLVRVEVDPSDGTLAIATGDGRRAGGLNRYVDGGDGGDTYTYSPPTADVLIENPETVSVDPVESGLLRGRLAVTTRYRWPSHALGDEVSCRSRSAETVAAVVRTVVELVAGDPVVRLDVEIDNRACDHRLRAHFPLPAPVAGSDAECAFTVVRRPLVGEGGLVEPAGATFPARRFVDCCDGEVGLAVMGDSVLEYEVLDGGASLAVTLLRAVGFLSRLRPARRPEPAGPPLPVPGAQLPGTVRRRLGVLLHRGDWRAAGLHRLADDLFVPMSVAALPGTAPGRRPRRGQALAVSGAEVSAVGRRGDEPRVRVFNPGPEPVEAELGGTRVDLAPHGITTVTLAPDPGRPQGAG